MTEKIILQVEAYLEKNCRDYDWRAKKINPNWTSREYLAFKTQENYDNFFAYLQSHKFTEEEIQKEFNRYTEQGYTVFKSWKDYINFVEQLEEQNFTPEKIDAEIEKYLSSHRGSFSYGDYDYLQSVSRTEKIIRTLKDKIGLAGSYFSNYLFKLIKKKNCRRSKFTKKQIWTGEFFQKSEMKEIICPASKQFLR